MNIVIIIVIITRVLCLPSIYLSYTFEMKRNEMKWKWQIDNVIKLKAASQKIVKCWHFNEKFSPAECVQCRNQQKGRRKLRIHFFSLKKRIVAVEKSSNSEDMHHARNTPRIFQRIIALLLFPQRADFTILLTFIDLPHSTFS